ncbi:MAG: hypothetical protein PUC12_17030 [Clostridiales bacterium]|nr:hypothetical protein [Clostridiales bacterium]
MRQFKKLMMSALSVFAFCFMFANVITVNAATVGNPSIALKESTASGQVTTSWKFTYSPVPAPVKDANGFTTASYKMYVLVFNKGDRTEPDYGRYSVDSLGKKVFYSDTIMYYVNPTEEPFAKYEFTIGSYNLTPGDKEVVAYIFDEAQYETDYAAKNEAGKAAYKAALDAYNADTTGTVKEPDSDDYYGNEKVLGISKADYYLPSAPVAISVSMEAGVSTAVTSNTITLSMGAGDATGYEVYRKQGSSYKKIATVASHVYKDSNLVSKATYSYKVRPYYVDKKTGKTTYGKYTVVEATTKGSALNLHATVTSSNKVKLSWKKVADATKYEIYRIDTNSAETSFKKSDSNDFTTYKLIATVKKNKKSYTDKKVSANRSYSYFVRAVLPKTKSVKGDQNRYVQEYAYASLAFGDISSEARYTDATGNKTIEWEKVYGATGYLVEKYAYDAVNDRYDWVEYKRLGKNATSVKLPAEFTYKADGTVKDWKTDYRIRAYKGTTFSGSNEYTTTLTMGNVSKVTATKTTNGIKVSWTPVNGAAYYKVYRLKTDSFTKNNNQSGAYNDLSGTEVTEYVGYIPAKAVDVAAWNAEVDKSIADYQAAYKAYRDSGYKKELEPIYENYLSEDEKLNINKGYHYQNYSYERNIFDANTTSMVDYFGDIYSGSGYVEVDSATKGADGKATNLKWKSSYNPVVSDEDVVKYGRPQEGVNYTYYVVAYAATAKTVADYVDDEKDYRYYYDNAAYDAAVNNGTDIRPNYLDYRYPYAADYYYTKNLATATYNTAVTGPNADSSKYCGEPVNVVKTSSYKDHTINTTGVKTLGSATYTSVNAPGKATIKSVKSSKKGQVTLKIKKKVSGATEYKIYRSTKKKSGYICVGTTTKLSFVDKSVKSGKKYYYKVVAVAANEAKADVNGKASAVKNVKAK